MFICSYAVRACMDFPDMHIISLACHVPLLLTSTLCSIMPAPYLCLQSPKTVQKIPLPLQTPARARAHTHIYITYTYIHVRASAVHMYMCTVGKVRTRRRGVLMRLMMTPRGASSSRPAFFCAEELGQYTALISLILGWKLEQGRTGLVLSSVCRDGIGSDGDQLVPTPSQAVGWLVGWLVIKLESMHAAARTYYSHGWGWMVLICAERKVMC